MEGVLCLFPDLTFQVIWEAFVMSVLDLFHTKFMQFVTSGFSSQMNFRIVGHTYDILWDIVSCLLHLFCWAADFYFEAVTLE